MLEINNIKDLLTGDTIIESVGIFDKMNYVITQKSTIFNDENFNTYIQTFKNELDIDYHLNFSGNKTPSVLVKNLINYDELDESDLSILLLNLSNVLLSRYYNKWKRLFKVMNANYNEIENYSMSESESSSNVKDSTINNTGTSDTKTKSQIVVSNTIENQKSSFDSSAYQNDSKVINDSTTSQDDNHNNVNETFDNTTEDNTSITETRTHTRSGNIGVTTSQQMIESEIVLRNHDLDIIIYKDIDELLTSHLY